MSNYFIKRGEKVHGPYTGEQISSGIKSKKLTAEDEVSVSKNGPWNPLQAFYDTILNKNTAQVQAGSQAPNENQMRIVQQFKLTKKLAGKYTAKYQCPYCNADLVSGEQELREGGQCPECRRPFRFSVAAIARIESLRQRKREKKEQKSKEREQRQLKTSSSENSTPRPNVVIAANGESTGSSLVKCEDCGKSISRRASSCPHCGAPSPTPEPTNDTSTGKGVDSDHSKRVSFLASLKSHSISTILTGRPLVKWSFVVSVGVSCLLLIAFLLIWFIEYSRVWSYDKERLAVLIKDNLQQQAMGIKPHLRSWNGLSSGAVASSAGWPSWAKNVRRGDGILFELSDPSNESHNLETEFSNDRTRFAISQRIPVKVTGNDLAGSPFSDSITLKAALTFNYDEFSGHWRFENYDLFYPGFPKPIAPEQLTSLGASNATVLQAMADQQTWAFKGKVVLEATDKIENEVKSSLTFFRGPAYNPRPYGRATLVEVVKINVWNDDVFVPFLFVFVISIIPLIGIGFVVVRRAFQDRRV